MKQKFYLSVAVLGLLITTAIVGITSFAATSSNNTDNGSRGFCQKQNKEEAIKAISNSDYSTWEQEMKQKVQDMRDQADKIEQTINQDTFNKMVLAHQLMQEGKTDEAKAIFEELGMPGVGPRQMGKGMQKGSCPYQNQAIGQQEN